MLVSQLLVPTLREDPAEAEVISHKLLLRAGFIRKAASGVYSYLPLAQRVLSKIKNIIREEMNSKGGQEVLLPIMQPAEIWKETGRWNVYGPELFRLKDRHGRDFCLGPTHEEIITDLVREIRSYKKLPLLLYQIQNKYRDERRPRFGLIRGREFIMKDLYSFDIDERGLDESYNKMYDAYHRVFTRCGLKFRPVEADSGAIGGSDTHEFMVLADSGEALILYCGHEECGYASNTEKAAASRTEQKASHEDLLPVEERNTPGQRTVEEVCAYLNVDPQKLIKTMLYVTDEGELVAALIRGDREVNEIKLKNALRCASVEMAKENSVQEATGAPAGFSGPVGLKEIKIVADREVAKITNAVAGANKADMHYINVNPVRDFQIDLVEDIRVVVAGEPCPLCGAPLEEARGIEVGQVFKLGTKYSEALQANFVDHDGNEKPMIMGCYGIGVSRVMAAAVEQNFDENGIVWPISIAPYEVIVVPVNGKNEEQMGIAREIYQRLIQDGVETVLDDRLDRPGVKFKDADLIGYPVRIVVGGNSVKNGTVEIKMRRNGSASVSPIEETVAEVRKILSSQLAMDFPV